MTATVYHAVRQVRTVFRPKYTAVGNLGGATDIRAATLEAPAGQGYHAVLAYSRSGLAGISELFWLKTS